VKKDSPNPISPRKLGLSPWPRADLPAHKLAQLEAMRHHADKQINNLSQPKMDKKGVQLISESEELKKEYNKELDSTKDS